LIEAVGHSGGRRLVKQAQHIQTGETRGVLGGLTLGIVKVGRHCDYHAAEFAAECGLGAVFECPENLG
jgi:hypothetical protein